MAVYLDHDASSPMHPEVVYGGATQAVGKIDLDLSRLAGLEMERRRHYLGQLAGCREQLLQTAGAGEQTAGAHAPGGGII